MNNWFKRYYTPKARCNDNYPDDSSFSNMMYDTHKGISIAFIPYAPNHYRPVSDVEIAMSTDPAITSRFSSEHRAMVKAQVLAQPRSVSSGPLPSDDQLMSNGAAPTSLERDEMVKAVRANSERFDFSARDIIRESALNSQSDESVSTNTESAQTVE